MQLGWGLCSSMQPTGASAWKCRLGSQICCMASSSRLVLRLCKYSGNPVLFLAIGWCPHHRYHQVSDMSRCHTCAPGWWNATDNILMEYVSCCAVTGSLKIASLAQWNIMSHTVQLQPLNTSWNFLSNVHLVGEDFAKSRHQLQIQEKSSRCNQDRLWAHDNLAVLPFHIDIILTC